MPYQKLSWLVQAQTAVHRCGQYTNGIPKAAIPKQQQILKFADCWTKLLVSKMNAYIHYCHLPILQLTELLGGQNWERSVSSFSP